MLWNSIRMIKIYIYFVFVTNITSVYTFIKKGYFLMIIIINTMTLQIKFFWFLFSKFAFFHYNHRHIIDIQTKKCSLILPTYPHFVYMTTKTNIRAVCVHYSYSKYKARIIYYAGGGFRGLLAWKKTQNIHIYSVHCTKYIFYYQQNIVL